MAPIGNPSLSPTFGWGSPGEEAVTAKLLPRDTDALRLAVGSISEMTDAEVALFARLLDRYGAAVLVPEQGTAEGPDVYSTLDRLLGTCVPHDRMDQRGVVEINPARPTSVNVAEPEKEHLPHTDDAYTERPASFMTLMCRVAAPSGGESVLVCGADLLGCLAAEEVEAMMRPGMVSMGRRQAGDGSWLKCSSIPLLWVDEDSGRVSVRWRCKDACVQHIDPSVRAAYERMDMIARDEERQLVLPLSPGDMLVVDNRAHAHGRRTYDASEPRIMWRKNYYGDGLFASQVSLGMCTVGDWAQATGFA